MSNVVGNLVVKLRADIAEFQSDMGKANQVSAQTAGQMRRAIATETTESKHSLELLSEEAGVHLPRALRNAIAGMDGLRQTAAAAFGAVAIAAFGKILIDQIVPAIQHGAEKLGGWGEEEKAVYEQSRKVNEEIAKQATKQKEILDQAKLIGKSEADQYRLKIEGIGLELKGREAALKSQQDMLKAAQAELAIDVAKSEALRNAFAISGATVASFNKLFGVPEASKAVTDYKESIALLDAQIRTLRAESDALGKALTQTLGDDASRAARTTSEAIAKLTEQVRTAATAAAAAGGDEVAKLLVAERAAIGKIGDAERDALETLHGQTNSLQAQLIYREAGLALVLQHKKAEQDIDALIAHENIQLAEMMTRFAKEGENAALFNVPIFGAPTAGKPGATKGNANPFQVDLQEFIKDTTAQYKLAEQIFVATRNDAEILAQELTKLNVLRKAGIVDEETYQRALHQTKAQLDLNYHTELELASVAGQGLKQILGDTKNWKQALVQVVEQLAMIIAKMLIMKALGLGPGQSGASKGIFGALLGGIFGFAGGGNPPVGVPSIVGENGPELFVPSVSGTIMSNDAMAGGGVVNNYYNIDARGADAGVEQRVMRAMRSTEERAVRRSVYAVQERNSRR